MKLSKTQLKVIELLGVKPSIDNYFNQIEDIIIKYTTPYTTGYCASPIAKKDL